MITDEMMNKKSSMLKAKILPSPQTTVKNDEEPKRGKTVASPEVYVSEDAIVNTQEIDILVIEEVKNENNQKHE